MQKEARPEQSNLHEAATEGPKTCEQERRRFVYKKGGSAPDETRGCLAELRKNVRDSKRLHREEKARSTEARAYRRAAGQTMLSKSHLSHRG